MELKNNRTSKAGFLEATARKEKVREKGTISVFEVKEVVSTTVQVYEWLHPRGMRSQEPSISTNCAKRKASGKT